MNKPDQDRNKQLYRYLPGFLIFALGILSLIFHEEVNHRIVLISSNFFSADHLISTDNLHLLKSFSSPLQFSWLLPGFCFSFTDGNLFQL